MQRLAIGMKVCDVRNRMVGVVARINACCFQVDKAAEKHFLVAGSVYNVQSDEVDLICDSKELGRYACGLHTA